MEGVGNFLRNHERIAPSLKVHLANRVEQFLALELADMNFCSELTSGDGDKLWQRLWEAVLGVRLHQLGYKPSSPDHGPDLKINLEKSEAWVEAICPGPIGLPKDWIMPARNSSVTSPPHAAFTLKWTVALKEKMEKLEGVGCKPGYFPNIVKVDEPYVIAVNSSRWRDAEIGLSQFPYPAEVGFGIGPISIPISSEGDFGEPQHTTKLNVRKARTGSQIDTAVFFNKQYNGISAVLSSGSLYEPREEFPITLVHNPYARVPLPVGLFAAVVEYTAVDKGDEILLTRIK